MTFDQGLAALQTRATLTRALLVAGMAISAIAFTAGSIALFTELGGETFRGMLASRAFLAALTVNTLASFAVLLVSIVAIMLWVHRAHANLRLARLAGLNYSPGWAVGSYFVPVVNLFVPFRIMRELYNRSHGEEPHFAAITVDDVNSWWTAYLVSNLVAAFLGLTQGLGVLGIYVTTPPGVNTALALFANALGIGASFLLYRIVGAVTRAQRSSAGVSEAFA
jgi:hypothetical protein